MGGGHLGSLGGEPGVGVEDAAVGLGIQEAVGVELAVHLDQFLAQALQQADADRLVVDPGAAATVGADGPADHQPLLRVEALLLQDGERRVVAGQIELRRHGGLVGAVAHQPRIGARAEREAQRVEQNRFARAGLAGQDAEALPEAQGEAFDQDDVPDRQRSQHGSA